MAKPNGSETKHSKRGPLNIESLIIPFEDFGKYLTQLEALPAAKKDEALKIANSLKDSLLKAARGTSRSDQAYNNQAKSLWSVMAN